MAKMMDCILLLLFRFGNLNGFGHISYVNQWPFMISVGIALRPNQLPMDCYPINLCNNLGRPMTGHDLVENMSAACLLHR